MTIKEFSAKYDIPYTTVYNASYLVKTHPMQWKNKQFIEQELKDAVLESLNRKMEKLKAEYIRAGKLMKKLL